MEAFRFSIPGPGPDKGMVCTRLPTPTILQLRTQQSLRRNSRSLTSTLPDVGHRLLRLSGARRSSCPRPARTWPGPRTCLTAAGRSSDTSFGTTGASEACCEVQGTSSCFSYQHASARRQPVVRRLTRRTSLCNSGLGCISGSGCTSSLGRTSGSVLGLAPGVAAAAALGAGLGAALGAALGASLASLCRCRDSPRSTLNLP